MDFNRRRPRPRDAHAETALLGLALGMALAAPPAIAQAADPVQMPAPDPAPNAAPDPAPARGIDMDWTEIETLQSVQAAASGLSGDGEVSEGIFTVEAPEVVRLGWAWSQSRAQPIPTVCVEFEPDRDLAQDSSIQVREVRDSYALAREMDLSASVTVNAVGFAASGKASVAKSTNVSTSSVNYVVRAEVLNSADFAGPKPAPGGDPSVRLTGTAAALAAEDLERFQQICGEGFVSAVRTGARAYLVASTKTSSRSDREEVRASVSGKGWGVQVEAAAKSVSGSTTENFERSMVFLQQGGSAEVDPEAAALPKDVDQAVLRIQTLATAAATAGKPFELQITPYQTLPNFPSGADILAQTDEQDQIAATWGAFATLSADLGHALRNPATHYAPLRRCLPDSGCATTLVQLSADDSAMRLAETMQDIALQALGQIEAGAQACVVSEEACDFDETEIRSAYAVRAGMPLQIPDPANLPAPEVAMAEHMAIHLRDPAAGRCAYGALTPGCVFNAELRRWADRTGMLSRRLKPGEVPIAGTPGVCVFGDGDRPDAPVVWYPVNKAGASDLAGLCTLVNDEP